MAKSLGDIKITASTDREAQTLIKMLQGKGITDITTMMGQGKTGKQQHIVAGRGPAGAVAGAAGAVPGVAPGQAIMTRIPVSVSGASGMLDNLMKRFPQLGSAVTQFSNKFPNATASMGRFGQTFNQKNMKDLNKSLFMMQMASLGVAFSFQSIIGSVMGLFSGLADLGTMISTGALGTTFAGMATGGANTTDIAATMGVTPEMQTAAWAGFTAIVSQITAVFNSLAVKVLSPEMVAAILSVVDALAVELAKPDTVKAIQQIVKAVLDIALAVIPLIGPVGVLIDKLGETGLLKLFIGIILAAEILLPTLAYVQFIFYAIEGVIAAVSAVAVILGISFGAVLLIVGLVVAIIDFFIHLMENLSDGMDIGAAILTAFGQTFADVMNTIISVINFFSNLLGAGSILSLWSTSNGKDEARTKAQTNITNITFAKNVDTKNRKEVSKVANQAAAATMG